MGLGVGGDNSSLSLPLRFSLVTSPGILVSEPSLDLQRVIFCAHVRSSLRTANLHWGSQVPMSGGKRCGRAHLPGPGHRASAGDSSSSHQASQNPGPCFQSLWSIKREVLSLQQANWLRHWGRGLEQLT